MINGDTSMVITYTNGEDALLVKLPPHWRFELKANSLQMGSFTLTLVLPKDDSKNEYLNIRNTGDYPNLPSGISLLIMRYLMKYISMKICDPDNRLIDVDSLERIAISEVSSCFDNLDDYL